MVLSLTFVPLPCSLSLTFLLLLLSKKKNCYTHLNATTVVMKHYFTKILKLKIAILEELIVMNSKLFSEISRARTGSMWQLVGKREL